MPDIERENLGPNEAERMERIGNLVKRPKVPPQATARARDGYYRRVLYDFSESRFPRLEILFITDIQYGHKSCRKDILARQLDWIFRKPNRFFILGGDCVDAGTPLSVGSPFEQEGEPQDEVLGFCELAAPYASRCLAMVGGNHERRGIQTFGDLGKLISGLLRVPYSPGRIHLDIMFGGREHRLTVWHGAGGAMTYGTVANKLERLIRSSDSTIFLMGHHHKRVYIELGLERRESGGRLRIVDAIGCTGTSFLEYWANYGEQQGHTPSNIRMPLVLFERDGAFNLDLKASAKEILEI